MKTESAGGESEGLLFILRDRGKLQGYLLRRIGVLPADGKMQEAG